MNINNLSNGPVSFGVNQSSVITCNKNENISESIKEDIKDNKNTSEIKKIILKWDTLNQKKFLYSSMEKDEEINNLNKVNLQSEFEKKDNEKKYCNQKRGQIIFDSINSTTVSQNPKNNYNNDININENNNYKAKLRSYKGNDEIKINDLNDINFNNQENNNENMNINDNINRNNNFEKDVEIKDNNNIKYLSNDNMINDNYVRDVEMKQNNDMKNAINDETGNNELYNKEGVSEQEFENTENNKTKNCQIF